MESISNMASLPNPADKIVAEFVEKITKIKPDFIDGVYLTGSLSLNDFYSTKSDIDFLVFCKELPNHELASQLGNIHKSLEKQYQKPDLSGSYLALDSLRADNPALTRVLTYHERSMGYGLFEMAPVSLSELKANAITVYGLKASMLPIAIDAKDLNKFLYDNINSYWTKWTHRYVQKTFLLLFPRLTEWAILGVARQLCTLQTGKIVSKIEAGLYALAHLPVEFHPIIREAIAIRKDNRTYLFVKSYAINPSFKRMTRTIDCINYIIALFNKIWG